MTLHDCLNQLEALEHFVVRLHPGVALLPRGVQETLEAAPPGAPLQLSTPASISWQVAPANWRTHCAWGQQVGRLTPQGQPALAILYQPARRHA